MSDGGDDQPPQESRRRERSRSRVRVHPHAQVPQVQIQFPHPISWTTTISLSREVAPEDKEDLDRVSGYLHIHLRMPASSRNLLNLLRELSKPRLWQFGAQMKIQQPWIHKIEFKVITRTRELTETGSKNIKREENYCRTAAE